MRNELVLQRRRRRPWRWFEFIVLLGFGLFLALGLGALYLLWTMDRQPALSLTSTPEQTLQVDQIVPHLATRHLAGDPLEGLARQAAQANQLATAYALLLFDTPNQPIATSALWLQLAQRQSQQADTARAARSVEMAQRIALLDPRLSPLERAQLLTECAKTYHDNGYDTLALFTIQQVVRITAQTPGWLPAQRSQLFSNLQPIFATLPENTESRTLKLQVDDFAANPYLSPTGIVITPTLFTFAHTVTFTEPVTSALAASQQAAKALADRYAITAGRDVDPEREALHVALLNEDRARFAYVQQGLNSATPIEDRFGILLAQRDWLTTRLRVALRGYGLPLVNEWEIDLEGMRRELNSNTTALDALFTELAAKQASPEQQTTLRLEAALWLAEQFELGLYPEGRGEDMGERIRAAQAEVEQKIGPLALPLQFDPNSERVNYDIQQR